MHRKKDGLSFSWLMVLSPTNLSNLSLKLEID